MVKLRSMMKRTQEKHGDREIPDVMNGCKCESYFSRTRRLYPGTINSQALLKTDRTAQVAEEFSVVATSQTLE